MIKRNVKFARLEIGRICSCCGWVDFEIFWLECCHEIEKGTAEVWQKSVVLLLDGICEDVVSLKQMTKVDIERRELIFTHGVDLFDIDKFTFVYIWCKSV